MKFVLLKPARINGKATKAYIKAIEEGWDSIPCEDTDQKIAKEKTTSAKEEEFFISEEVLERARKACMDYQEDLSINGKNGKIINPHAKFPPEAPKK